MKRIIMSTLLIVGASVTVYAASVTTYTTLQFRRGLESQLPVKGRMGEPFFTSDTHRVFVGYSTGRIELGRNSDIPVNTDSLPEGTTNKYYTDVRAALKADDSAAVHKTGNESLSGTKTFTNSIIAPNFTAIGTSVDGGAF